jgi:arylsulfatase A-like enzyme
MFTGLFSTTLRVNDAGIDQMSYIPRNVLTLGELFKQRGYRTAAFTDGGLVTGDLGFNRGFDVYRDVTVSGMRQNVGEAIEYLRSNQIRKPFFVFLHTYDVHAPYRPANTGGRYEYRYTDRNYDGDFRNSVEARRVQDLLHEVTAGTRSMTEADTGYLVSHYDHAVSYVDRQIGRLLQFLEDEGFMDDTIVLLTSDHGERFSPLRADGFRIAEANFFSHSGCTHEMLHVPYLIYAPGLAPERVPRPISASLSIFPTLLDLLGWDVKARYELEGRSAFHQEPR